jgi:DNA mismatch repair protein MSH5
MAAPPRAAPPAEEEGADAHDDCLACPVLLAVHVAGGRLGAAWLDAETGGLRCVEGADEGPGAPRRRLLELVKAHARPAVAYASARADEGLLAALRAPLPGGSVDVEVRLERAALFHPRAARAALEATAVGGEPPGLPARDRAHRLNARLSLAAEAQVAAAGALLAAAARDGALPAPPPGTEPGSVWLPSLEEASLDGYLLVDPPSAEALGIFAPEAHPSAMGLGAAKEGLSALGALDRCATPPGRRLLRLWLARPLLDLEALEARLDAVAALVAAPGEAAAARAALRGARDPARLLARLAAGAGAPPDLPVLSQMQEALAALLRARGAAAALAAGAAAAGGRPGLLAELAERVDAEALAAAHALLAGVLDPSQAPDGFAVAPGVSCELDALKAEYFALPDLLARVARRERARARPSAAGFGAPDYGAGYGAQTDHNSRHDDGHGSDGGAEGGAWAVAYLPQVGFVLQVEGPLLGAHALERLGGEAAFSGLVGEEGRPGALMLLWRCCFVVVLLPLLYLCVSVGDLNSLS